jgi:redox-sensitive bicupin YhaK (pirin superfamily)
MERKDFIRKGLLGTAMFSAVGSIANFVDNNIDELKKLDIIGFNHLPNEKSEIMANTVLHKASTRGHANHGWLNSYHSFSFANYYNPDRMHFGVLRVLNDDQVQQGMGFGTHPHDNMEIISIPLEGDLEHKDSMGNVATIKHGDIQVMSAGTGIQHSEYNRNKDIPVKFLQIWLFPNKKNVTPRYDQLSLQQADRHNRLQQILSPSAEDEGVWIYQDAWFHMGTFDKDQSTKYSIKKNGNGVYAFILKGQWEIAEQNVEERDGLGIWDTNEITLKALTQDAEILLMDIPMTA